MISEAREEAVMSDLHQTAFRGYLIDHHSPAPPAAAQIAAAGCRVFLYSGSQHVDGTLEHEEARRIGKAYQDVARMEPYLSGRKLVAEVAILQSDLSSAAKAGNRVVMNAIGRCKQSDPHRAAILHSQICLDVIIRGSSTNTQPPNGADMSRRCLM